MYIVARHVNKFLSVHNVHVIININISFLNDQINSIKSSYFNKSFILIELLLKAMDHVTKFLPYQNFQFV